MMIFFIAILTNYVNPFIKFFLKKRNEFGADVPKISIKKTLFCCCNGIEYNVEFEPIKSLRGDINGGKF